ncbi:putative DNA binding domain-containing protein [Patescibacteria group bacterium]|nr:putative DNA binding domain-containing protein [Patescibacteria group bacterium]MBU4579418.1 putative DNA binding domain-containing protein [Patescibacteria group bacterium]
MVKTTEEQFKKWLETPEEGLNLEFKKAENNFNKSKDLPDYCAALANERGGKLILGVTNDRIVTGTRVFSGTVQTLPNDLMQLIGIRIDIEEFFYEGERVLIFHIPSRPIGKAIKSNKVYWMRAGSSLVPMDEETLKNIFNENIVDFSSQIVHGMILADISGEAIDIFRNKWAKKQNQSKYLEFSDEKTLREVGLMDENNGITYAALILFGNKNKIDQFLPCAEISYEWRMSNTIKHDFRANWREPFFKVYDAIWQETNNRNIRFPYQEGFVQREILAFSEKVIREAVLNAVAHRDYSIQNGWIFIKASPYEYKIESPGGFLPGITEDNAIDRRATRNRLICEIFEKAGLVERSGQGIDLIFEITIREGKGLPSFKGTDNYRVVINIPAEVKDFGLVKFIEKIANEKQLNFSTEEIIKLERIKENGKIKGNKFIKKFLSLGIIEKVGKTNDSSYMLSHRYYINEGKSGIYTRIVGLSREEKKQLILKHIQKNKKGYAKDFKDVFSELKPKDVSNFLQELKNEGKIIHKGSDRSGYWEIQTSSN